MSLVTESCVFTETKTKVKLENQSRVSSSGTTLVLFVVLCVLLEVGQMNVNFSWVKSPAWRS